MEDIIKLIKSLENRVIYWKELPKRLWIKKWRFLQNVLDLLMKVGLPSMKNVLTPLGKTVFLSFGLTAAVSATDAALQKKIYESLIVSKKWRNMEIVKYLEQSVKQKKIETIENEAK